MENLLGADLVHLICRRLAGVDSVTPEWVRAVDDEFHITQSYGVPRRRLKSLLQRLMARANGAAGAPRASGPVVKRAAKRENRAGWKKKLGRHRRRQASVASILDSVFGGLADCDPALWERRAYLMVIGMVYERLATSEQDLSDESLLKLANALAQQRRIGAAAIKKKPTDPKETSIAVDSMSGRVSDRFARLIQQVYGTGMKTED